MTVDSTTTSGGPVPSAVVQLLHNNRDWAAKKLNASPDFFHKLASGQQPEILWIGCSDSRVPPTEILQIGSGDAFVHRNIANIIVPSDLSFLSVLQYAVEVLKVQHVIVCGHYSCGGVRAAMGTKRHGLIDNWLQQVKDLHAANLDKLEALPTQEEREDLMCELNALNSFSKVVSTGIIQGAWERGQKVTVHAWCYRLSDGIIRDLGIVADSNISLNEKLGELIAAKTMPEP